MLFQESYVGNISVYDVIDPRLCTFCQQSSMQLVQPKSKTFPAFRFPGPMPITVERCHVLQLSCQKFLLTPKADGVRVLVVFLRYFLEGARQPMCFLIHRDGRVQLITQHTDLRVYDNGGSVFDAELVTLNDEQTNQLLLFDCYAYKGVNTTTLPLQKRLHIVERFVGLTDTTQPNTVQMVAKEYFPLNVENIDFGEHFLNNSHNLPFNTDGVVLVSPGAMTKCGTSDEQFKLKSCHTVDLIIVKDDDGDVYLASLDENDDSYVTKQEVDASLWQEKSVVECDVQLMDSYTLFTPRFLRPDKNIPNTERVIERTLQTIRDNVTLRELVRT